MRPRTQPSRRITFRPRFRGGVGRSVASNPLLCEYNHSGGRTVRPLPRRDTSMKLSVKFSGAVLLLVAVSLGLTAWLLIRRQTQNLNDEALERSRIILSMGEASREYARETLSPAIRKAVDPHNVGPIFEGESSTFVARGTFEAFRKREPEYSFRE